MRAPTVFDQTLNSKEEITMIRIAIAGYGNLGRGTELAVAKNPDMKLVAVFSRRDPETVKLLDPTVPVYRLDDAASHKDEIDVLIICGGSATDLPTMTPALARDFNVIDSFDTHAKIPEHFANVDAAAKESGHIAMISVGWDPGMFSVARLYGLSILPDGADYTFWGRGVSQGHSDAIRRIPGVVDARQYTVPVDAALERVRAGEQPSLTIREKHTRECYVVAEEGADQAAIEQAIVTMPTTLPTTTQRSISFPWTSCAKSTWAFRTAARSSVPARRVRTTKTPTSSNTS